MSEEKHFLGSTNLTDILTKIKTWVSGFFVKKGSNVNPDTIKECGLYSVNSYTTEIGSEEVTFGCCNVVMLENGTDGQTNYYIQILRPSNVNAGAFEYRRYGSSSPYGIGWTPWEKYIPSKVSELTNDAGYTTNTGTITEIKMNGSSKGTSGSVDLGTVITSHQDISGKVNKSGDTISAPFNDGGPALSIISTNNDYDWQYALGIFNPHITQGKNIYVPIGKGYASKQCTGLRYHFEGDHSDENFLGFEIYGNGTPFLIKSNKTVHTDNLTSYSPIKISSNGVTGWIGAQNDGWFHITNENSKPFYFNRAVYVDGNSMPYGGNKDVGSNEERWRYMYSAYFNASCGQENHSVNSIIYENGDGWFRKATVDHIRNALRQVTKVSDNRPGTYKIYRRDDDAGYSVQTWWDGSRWVLDGYHSDDSYHAPCRVNYADSAGSAPANGGTSTYSNYVNSLGGNVTPKSGREVYHAGVYTYGSYTDTNTPTYYSCTIGFGTAGNGAAELCAGWCGQNGLWYRTLRDWEDSWYSWSRLIESKEVSVVAIANKIVQRNNSGEIYATYYNSSCGQENYGITNFIYETNNDGWLRKCSPAHARSQLVSIQDYAYTYSINAYSTAGFYLSGVGVSGYYCIGFIVYDTGAAGCHVYYQGTDGYMAIYNATGTNYSSITLRARGIYLRA